METFPLDHDIHVFCVPARSFPEGVQQAHQTLHGLVPFSPDRKYFGLSWMGADGQIEYKAAAEEREPGELSQHGLEEFTIRKGTYQAITVHDFMRDIPAIGNAFQLLLRHPNLDQKGACVEWYLSDQDCRCMVRLT